MRVGGRAGKGKIERERKEMGRQKTKKGRWMKEREISKTKIREISTGPAST